MAEQPQGNQQPRDIPPQEHTFPPAIRPHGPDAAPELPQPDAVETTGYEVVDVTVPADRAPVARRYMDVVSRNPRFVEAMENIMSDPEKAERFTDYIIAMGEGNVPKTQTPEDARKLADPENVKTTEGFTIARKLRKRLKGNMSVPETFELTERMEKWKALRDKTYKDLKEKLREKAEYWGVEGRLGESKLIRTTALLATGGLAVFAGIELSEAIKHGATVVEHLPEYAAALGDFDPRNIDWGKIFPTLHPSVEAALAPMLAARDKAIAATTAALKVNFDQAVQSAEDMGKATLAALSITLLRPSRLQRQMQKVANIALYTAAKPIDLAVRSGRIIHRGVKVGAEMVKENREKNNQNK